MKKHEHPTNRLEKMSNFFGGGNFSKLNLYTFLTILLGCHTLVSEGAPVRIEASAPGTVFQQSEQPGFEISPADTPPGGYEVLDWQGNPVETGQWKSGALTLKNRLPRGYYRLVLKHDGGNAERSFVIVPDLDRRAGIDNDFYALDSGQATHADFQEGFGGDDPVKLLADLTRLAGVQHVRNRYYWGAYNPKPGVYTRENNFTRSMELLKERGIRDSVVFADSPYWTRTQSKKLPDDLMELYTVMKKMAADYQDGKPYWEFWNEPDIGFAPEPGWHFAACQKAAYLGLKAGAPDAEVLNGGLSGLNGSYEVTLFKNGMADYFDIFNIHTYSSPSTYRAYAEEIRRALGLGGIPGARIHMTESSTNAEGAAEESLPFVNQHRTKGQIQTIGRHSPRQEMLLAEYYPKSMLEFQQEGIERVYYFYLAPYNEREGSKDWGIMRRDATVKPVYASIANMTWVLAGAEYRGKTQLGKTMKGYLLKHRDGSDVLAFWSKSPLDGDFGHNAVSGTQDPFKQDLVLKVPAGKYLLTDLFGKETELTSNGELKLEATRYPAYLKGKFDLPVSERPFTKAKAAGNAEEAKDKTVVFDAYVNPGDFRVVRHKSAASLIGDTGRITVKIWNLSDRSKTGTVSAENGILSGLPGEITLKPFSCRTLECEFTPLPGDEAGPDLKISGVFAGMETTPLVIPIQIEKRITKGTEAKALQADRPGFWRKNAGGNMKISDRTEENAVRFDTDFSGGKLKWAYPEYILQPGESLKDAVMLTFEIKSRQDRVENHFGRVGVFLVEGQTHERGKSIYLDYPAPIHDWEERRIVLTDLAFPLEKTGIIRIGANPVGEHLTLWIRNVRVHYKSKPTP